MSKKWGKWGKMGKNGKKWEKKVEECFGDGCAVGQVFDLCFRLSKFR